MKMKNDCERDYIKEAFDKLYDRVMPYIDLNEFANADMAFKELDKKVHSEIYILKKCLAESDRAVDSGLTRSKVLQERISELENELAQARNSTELLLRKENDRLRIVIDGLEKENASLRLTPFDTLEALKKENNTLKKKVHELEEESIHKRPWHGDGNAIMTGARTWSEMLAETIEFQNRKIEELEAEKARLKEAYDIHETTIKRLKLLLGKEHIVNEDLSYGHEFEFGDKVFVPWSDGPYMYIKPTMLYNPRTESCVYVGKTQHLKWFGEKFSIV